MSIEFMIIEFEFIEIVVKIMNGILVFFGFFGLLYFFLGERMSGKSYLRVVF